MAWTCPQCGCQTYHYNRNRVRLECDSCGHPVDNEQDVQRQMQYDRSLRMAKEHLRAGNWESALSQLNALTSQRPADRELYRLIFQAATHDYQDLEMADTGRRRVASDAWDKLARLQGLTDPMVRYGQRREAARFERLMMRRNQIIRLTVLSACAFLLGMVLLHAEAGFGAFVMICAGGGGIYNLVGMKPSEVIRQLNAPAVKPYENPFIRD